MSSSLSWRGPASTRGSLLPVGVHSAGMRSQNCRKPNGGAGLPKMRMKAGGLEPCADRAGSAAAGSATMPCASTTAIRPINRMTPLRNCRRCPAPEWPYGSESTKVLPYGFLGLDADEFQPDTLIVVTHD